ncbi:anti-sigma factor family protein [Streptosporangium sp. NPDC052375]|uniref:anti-sigma factor family protein n=1 Tax=Streptosporangium sp. NPDC052375 TaxID=3366195 RepID=UPI0037D98146
MMMTTCEEVRISLGAYVLGALEPEECVLVEAHLAECAGCQAEFEELTGVATFLGRVSEADVAQVSSPPQAVLDRLLSAKVKRRRRLTRALLSLAASVVLVGVGGTLWSTTQTAQNATTASAPQSSGAAESTAPFSAKDDGGHSAKERAAPSQSAVTEGDARLMLDTGERKATDRNGSVRATVTASPGEKATTVKVVLTGVAKGTRCRLDVVGVGGVRETAGNWIVDRAAYDASGAFTGTTTIPPANITKFEILTAEGRMLVSVALP